MLRIFRFSLLGLLAFTAIVAVGITWWIAPFEKVMLTAEFISKYQVIPEYEYTSTAIDMAENSSTVQVTVVRDFTGIHFHGGPVTCRYAKETYELHDSNDKNSAYKFLLLKIESAAEPPKAGHESEKMNAVIFDTDRHGKLLFETYYVISNLGNVYYGFEEDEWHLLYLRPLNNDFSAFITGQNMRNEKLVKAIEDEVKRVKNAMSK